MSQTARLPPKDRDEAKPPWLRVNGLEKTWDIERAYSRN